MVSIIHKVVSAATTIALPAALLLGCGSDSKDPPLFEPKPDCMGVAVTPLSGDHAMVISFLEVGKAEDGFDLDGDGDPDNKLAAVGSLAKSAIDDSFDDFSIVIPFELFDFAEVAEDQCVKFGIYLGNYKMDVDADGADTADDKGDCNDHDAMINRSQPEVAGNFKDDNCNGLADETITTEETDAGTTMTVTPSTDTSDMDGDGVTLADGDCDDTNDTVHLGATEICGDGLDNDCDGRADWSEDTGTGPACSPYDETPDLISLDPLAFESDGSPKISFRDGTVTSTPAGLQLLAGPSIFAVNIPVTDDLSLELRISGATIEGEVVMTPAGPAIVGGRLGGVIDAATADKIRGLDVSEIGLLPEDSLLDAIFANILGPLLALPSLPDTSMWAGCRTPDIDVDRDGLEAFCDSDPLDERQTVDVCIDGDGTVVRDEVDGAGNVTKHCSEARDSDGNLMFVDGISVEINFDTMPTLLPTMLP